MGKDSSRPLISYTFDVGRLVPFLAVFVSLKQALLSAAAARFL